MTQLRTESFVPLTAAPAPPSAREFAVTVTPSGTPKAEKNFQSLEPLRPATPVNPSENKTCEPRVTVQRDGNRVTHLRIQCTCGQVMDLACLYDEKSA
jgi:hypothetical protein